MTVRTTAIEPKVGEHRAWRRIAAACLTATLLGSTAATTATATAAVVTPRPILFVTQVPVGAFGTVTSIFDNHEPGPQQAPRGGDLVLRYPNGTLRFLTAEAGFGAGGQQGANAIAVREPCVHWSGEKALFSMAIGAPAAQYDLPASRWQIYEVSGFAEGATATIRRIASQPSEYNNVSPIYGSDDRILFASDRPPSGAAHHYPPLDEYESSPTVDGIYALNEADGSLALLEHAPSGIFSLSLDTAGRVIFTKWDHIQRDQQGDTRDLAASHRAFTWASPAVDAPTTKALAGAEVFPEPRTKDDPSYAPMLNPHSFNHFFPWEMNEDGTDEETLNHIGRHEFGGTFTDGSFANDPNLTYFTPPEFHANTFALTGTGGVFHLREDPTHPGEFLTTHAPEFATASGGVLLRLTGPAGMNADAMTLTPVTTPGDVATVPNDTGYFRNPLPLSDGTIVAAHTRATDQVLNRGTVEAPAWSYAYRLKQLTRVGAYHVPGETLTDGITRSVSWWTPDVLAAYNGPLWELDPVEVAPRTRPTSRLAVVPAIEAGVFQAVGVDVAEFRRDLRTRNLALIVSRNVTQRERSDRHQPFNLRVPGGVESIGAPGTVYDVSYLQVFQADPVRGYGDPAQPNPGRRPLPRPMHETGVTQSPGAPSGGLKVAADGSIAGLVPARRALTWQLTGPSGAGVVREREWVSFQAGEIRVCANCHGINTASQTNESEPINPPEALRALLERWKNGEVEEPTSCTSGITIGGARLQAKGGTVVLTGTVAVPSTWASGTPGANGARVVLADLDVTVPGGGGWKAKRKGSSARYTDAAGSVGGIRQIDLASRTKRGQRSLHFTIRLGRTVAAPAIPLTLALGFGSANECAAATWNPPGGSAPRCRTSRKGLVCR